MEQAGLFAEAVIGSDRLAAWAPQQWPVAPDWQPLIDRFLSSEAGQRLRGFIEDRLAAGATIYPPQPFRALALTPLSQVRVVIVGQDPYHGPGQAEGLAFSVAPGVRPPPSLRNIFKELARESFGAGSHPLPADGSLVDWAQQGALLLNTCLTVEQGLPASHAGKGWEALTDEIISTVIGHGKPVAFMLWGAQAQALGLRLRSLTNFEECVGGVGRHLVLTANHPSPLSALRPPQPFIGCGHFEQVNAFLRMHAELPMRW